jgi:predicted lipoprotein with Yx(FWY)xxD motif
MSSLRSVAAIVLIAGLAAACTSGGAATTAPTQAPVSQAATSSGPAPASAGTGAVVVTSGTSDALGSYLIGPRGLALYTHSGDSPTSSTCTGVCAVAWPPLTVDAGSQASGGSGVTGTFGTLTRADGTTQVTYLGNPLYYWKGDTKPTDTTGEGVNGFLVAGVSGPIPNPSSSVKPGY